MKKIFIAETKDFSTRVLQNLKIHFDVTFRNASSFEINDIFCNYEIFWFRLGFKIDSKVLDQPNLKVKVIVCPVTGLDHIDTNKCKKLGIKLISLKGESEFLKSVRATAELTLLLSLELIRNTRNAYKNVLEGKWNRDKFKGNELFEKKVAIIGYGRLGKITADMFASFGAVPVVYDKENIKSKYKIAKTIDAALKNAYLCSIHVSYSVENIQFFNLKLINMLPKGCFIVNTSRGSLVNEKDVVQALKDNHITGYATDVINDEPEIHKSILWKYAKNNKNVIITPHIGGNTFESFKKTENFVAKKLIKLYA